MGEDILPRIDARAYKMSGHNKSLAQNAQVEIMSKQKKVDFPEIETVYKVNTETQSPPLRTPGLAKKRFTNIALKLMSKMAFQNERIDEDFARERNSEEEVSNKKRDEKIKDNNINLPDIAPPSRRDSVSRSRSKGSIFSNDSERQFLPPIRRGSRNKFSSLVRLAKYRKMMMRSRTGSIASLASDITEESEDNEEPIMLPSKPRFSATLSPEAQYAMLKGYEDILLLNLDKELKKHESNHPNYLYRVKTPHHKIVSVHLNNLESRQAELIKQIERSNKRIASPSVRETTSPEPETDEDEPVISRTIPKEKQIWLTHRFQCAMDILDKIKDEEGCPGISPRYKNRKIDPVINYNTWSQDWAKEFKLEFA